MGGEDPRAITRLNSCTHPTSLERIWPYLDPAGPTATEVAQCSHIGRTLDAHWIHSGLTLDSQWTHG